MISPLLLITILPLIGFFINGLFGNKISQMFGEKMVGVIACLLPIISFILTVIVFLKLASYPDGALTEHIFTWASIGGVSFGIDLYFDRLSGLMTLIVTGVGSLIHIYSTGYMHGDKSYPRFFAYLNLFLFFMLLLVLGQSLLVLFVGWEGVGLVSYLLIGFWFENGEFASAGKKAFVVNRIGDSAFLLGMFALFFTFGTLDIPTINAIYTNPQVGQIIPTTTTAFITLMLFIGATGKSAQIPLYTWLPDAMAGPTPVSALIHAATMVTAGIYLIARLAPVYLSATDIMLIIAIIGALTSLLAGIIALTQTDIKKVLAYSTVSQLGLMFTALGVGAFGVAIFHVFTHAFFKACLFLGAGSVIHALSGEQNIFKMGGLWKKIPVTFATFAVATLAIAGLPPLSGFFSKDEILWVAYASNLGANGHWWLWLIISIASFLTSFYMFRLLWLTFFGKSRVEKNVEKHIHESPNSMIFILIILAVFSALAGFVHIPEFLHHPVSVREALHSYEKYFIIIAVVLALAGLLLAKIIYGKDLKLSHSLQQKFPKLHNVVTNKFYVDEFYQKIIGAPYAWLSEVLAKVIDIEIIGGIVRGSSTLVRGSACIFSKVQNGNLQLYVLVAFAGIVFIVFWSILG